MDGKGKLSIKTIEKNNLIWVFLKSFVISRRDTSVILPIKLFGLSDKVSDTGALSNKVGASI